MSDPVTSVWSVSHDYIQYIHHSQARVHIHVQVQVDKDLFSIATRNDVEANNKSLFKCYCLICMTKSLTETSIYLPSHQLSSAVSRIWRRVPVIGLGNIRGNCIQYTVYSTQGYILNSAVTGGTGRVTSCEYENLTQVATLELSLAVTQSRDAWPETDAARTRHLSDFLHSQH